MTRMASSPAATGLALFAATADERWLLGEETFLSTHIPMSLRSQRAPLSWSDEDLLRAVLEPTAGGNRVFALYGAAGSGKSELMRWLACKIEQQDPARAPGMVRLARTDLGTPALLARLGPLLSAAHDRDLWAMRWEVLRNAPLALTNAIVWHALGRLATDDAQCLAAGYALRPLVERALGELLAGAVAPRPFDVVWGDELQQSVRDHPALAGIDGQKLRRELVAAFDTLVLPTPDIAALLRAAGESLIERGIRPLLLIDDLVQALPTHAGTILDWATTLDEGHWDVVCGLTPGALHDERHSRTLLDRISRLDTFDDRMRKLWLSDEAGHVCYALPEARAEQLLRAYLGIYRRLRGPSSAMPESDGLWPFTPDLVRRLYRSIPIGKGAPRQLLLQVRTALIQLESGTSPTAAIAAIVPPEASALHPDPIARQALEVYGVLRRGRLDLDGTIASRLGLGSRIISARAVPLHRPSMAASTVESKAEATEQDPVALAVRTWLLGQPTNGQALRPLRLGIARVARLSPYGLGAPGAARSAALHLERTGNGTCPAVRLEGVDARGDIVAGRWLSDVAYDLARLGVARGGDVSRLLRRILSAPQSARLLWAVRDAAARARAEIDATLGVPLTTFIGSARRLAALGWGASEPPLPLLDGDVMASGIGDPGPLSPGMPLRSQLENITADLFCLRENVWDGPLLTQILAHRTEQDLATVVLSAHPAAIDAAFHLDGQPLCEVLTAIRDAIASIVRPTADDAADRACIRAIHSVVDGSIHHDLAEASALCVLLARTLPEVEAAGAVLASLQPERMASAARRLADTSYYDENDGATLSVACWVRRRAVLAVTITPEERQALLQLQRLSTLVHAPPPDVVESLRSRVRAMLTRAANGRGSRTSAPRRRWTAPELLRLAAIVRAAETLRLGFDWSRYLDIPDRAQRRAAAAAMRDLDVALRTGSLSAIEARFAACIGHIAVLTAEIQVPERDVIEQVQRAAPQPPRWLAQLLRALCSATPPHLGGLEAKAIGRMCATYPELAPLVAVHFVGSQTAESPVSWGSGATRATTERGEYAERRTDHPEPAAVPPPRDHLVHGEQSTVRPGGANSARALGRPAP